MTTTEHTPGPWRTVRFASKLDSRVQAFGIAYGRSGNKLAIVDGEGASADANAANARLIAAAPDLLEACERLLGFANHYGSESAVAAAHGLFEAARAAIAKAKGV